MYATISHASAYTLQFQALPSCPYYQIFDTKGHIHNALSPSKLTNGPNKLLY